MKRVMAFMVAVLLAAVAVPGVASAQTGGPILKDPVSWHQQMIDAVNAGNANAAGALLADNVKMSGGFTCAPVACNGKAAVQREIATAIANHVNIRRTSASAFVGEVTSWEEHRADMIRAAGVERVIVKSTVKYRDEKIASITFELDARDAQTAKFLDYISKQGSAPAPAAPAVVPARLPSTGSAGTLEFATGSAWIALATLLGATLLGGLALARRRS